MSKTNYAKRTAFSKTFQTAKEDTLRAMSELGRIASLLECASYDEGSIKEIGDNHYINVTSAIKDINVCLLSLGIGIDRIKLTLEFYLKDTLKIKNLYE